MAFAIKTNTSTLGASQHNDLPHIKRGAAARRLARLNVLIATLLSGHSMSAAAVNVEVTIKNNTGKAITNVSSSYGFPNTLRPWESKTFTVYANSFRSNINANYASGQTPGGCLFQVGHTMNSIGPRYSSHGKGYGQVLDPFCFVYVRQKWSAPYNYKVNLMISQ